MPKPGYRFSADVNQIFQPANQTILEKRTVKRLTVSVEEEFDDAPRQTLPPKPQRFSRLAVFLGLVLIISGTTVFLWFRQSRKQTVKADDNGIVFLTGGSQDDSGAN